MIILGLKIPRWMYLTILACQRNKLRAPSQANLPGKPNYKLRFVSYILRLSFYLLHIVRFQRHTVLRHLIQLPAKFLGFSGLSYYRVFISGFLNAISILVSIGHIAT